MEEIRFIEQKIDQAIGRVAVYRAKGNLDPWEEVSLNEHQKELDMYISVLSKLKVWEQVKNGKMEAA